MTISRDPKQLQTIINVLELKKTKLERKIHQLNEAIHHKNNLLHTFKNYLREYEGAQYEHSLNAKILQNHQLFMGKIIHLIHNEQNEITKLEATKTEGITECKMCQGKIEGLRHMLQNVQHEEVKRINQLIETEYHDLSVIKTGNKK
ncbi:hypothetical protein [Legionella nagasakiensis]|uniref:hypothetical protein n=1 Tax=Legionella nagasakiensis TaxID=535290 RepID=UPI0010564F8D|nr:hypothetical protein [Legionella nagasakiensis]